MATQADVLRWQSEVAPHADLVEAVRSGRRQLKAAARTARERERDIAVMAGNAILEAQQEEGWRRAPLMTCPNGHAVKCSGCANEYRFT